MTVTGKIGEIGRQSAAIFGMDAFGDQHFRAALVDAHGHEHALGHRAAAFVKAGVGDIHAGQLADERLIFEKRLQASLAGLGLVGRVGGVEFAAAGDGIDDGGNEMIVTAAAEESRPRRPRTGSCRPAQPCAVAVRSPSDAAAR